MKNVLWVVQQAMVEMGLAKPVSVVSNEDETVQQMLALLNRAGADMVIGFPWEQLSKEFAFTTEAGVTSYDLPSDWSYFMDQTQWDRTNHWPLMGPKTAQEWAWLKGGILQSGPRLRYRVLGGKFEIFPTDQSGFDVAMEYVSDSWLADAEKANTYYSEVQSDTDQVLFDAWILSAYLKLKYWEAKGLNTTAFTKDFLGTWEARIGKNKGGDVLYLAANPTPMYIGYQNIPDGNWDTTP